MCITFSLAAVFLVVQVPYCFGNNDPLSTALWNRIEALERRDKEQSMKIDALEQRVSLSNEKLTIFSTLNENIKKELAVKTKKLEKQDDILAALQKDIELQTLEAAVNRRKIEVLELKVHELHARLTETEQVSVQPEDRPEVSNEINVKLNGTEGNDDKNKHLNTLNSRTESANHRTVGELLDNTSGNMPDKAVYGQLNNRGIGRHAVQRFLTGGVQEGPVAFHAVISKALVQHLGIDQNIVFDVVELNLGGGYHNQHGLFIAPKSGLYIFSTSLLSYVNAKAEFDASIVKNGNILASAFGHGDSGRHDQGSVTVVTQLNVGDEISVKNRVIADDAYWGDRYSSFMGILVIEM
ncbi:uncharacterized protein LOC123540350 [Mercenaria mercenaria]|uniref:uncharacterized protein LOC123540350 n=1 Tax=Mercenaria mercenaria TaxID=6596 RepID=UPI00234E5390|nr:uncharacterized protein LOC123540350 [Mercenaria mercenaria]